MKTDFAYSKKTGLYVARSPLRLDSRVNQAADDAGVKLDWDDEGRIINLDFDSSKKLLESLDSVMMTPIEYWTVHSESDPEMRAELESPLFAEWLDRVYLQDLRFIDNPSLEEKYQYAGKKETSNTPLGRPGWFTPQDNILENGEPRNVLSHREKFSSLWKYWSPDLSVTKLGAVAPIRGYVTSVGMPSYDLGIPVDARQPKLMIRECRRSPLNPMIDPVILNLLDSIKTEQDFLAFIKNYGGRFLGDDSLSLRLKEEFFDRLGNISSSYDVSDCACALGVDTDRFGGFREFINSRRACLEKALQDKNDICFVMGHRNPDTDTAISSMVEAWRNHCGGSKITYIPVIQSSRVPDEVSRLLGGLAEKLVLTTDPLYSEAKRTGLSRWISVDQNREPEVQKYFSSIIDHHAVCDAAKKRVIPKTLEMLGSTAALITNKLLGMGVDIPIDVAHYLYAAALMDTENRVAHKMTSQDIVLMDHLQRITKDEDDPLYSDLMSHLLNTDDSSILFQRDYKEDWGFGFAVAKIKGGFNREGELMKGSLYHRLCELASKNTLERNLPLTLVKLTDYLQDNENVNLERLYCAFNPETTQGFKDAVMDVLEQIVTFEFPSCKINKGEHLIDFSGRGLQLSRKKTAPVLQSVVSAFNSYFHSSSINKWVKRDFLRDTREVRKAEPGLSVDYEGRINHITYLEAKNLCEKLGVGMLSLGEFWKVLDDAQHKKDGQMVGSMSGSNFVEFLDSVIKDKSRLIDHPGLDLEGMATQVKIPSGNPGLVHTDEIDRITGIPLRVRPCNEYGNKELWRYWQPDSDLVIPCRSYIFLLDQPCWDGKFHLEESFPNLGIRPVRDSNPEPRVSVSMDNEWLKVEVQQEGERRIYNWPKRIKDFDKAYVEIK